MIVKTSIILDDNFSLDDYSEKYDLKDIVIYRKDNTVFCFYRLFGVVGIDEHDTPVSAHTAIRKLVNNINTSLYDYIYERCVTDAFY